MVRDFTKKNFASKSFFAWQINISVLIIGQVMFIAQPTERVHFFYSLGTIFQTVASKSSTSKSVCVWKRLHIDPKYDSFNQLHLFSNHNCEDLNIACRIFKAKRMPLQPI